MSGRHTRRWREVIVPRIIRRDGGICHLCGQPGATTADHLTPVKHGGTDDPRNLAAAHIDCNKRRGIQPVHEARARLQAPHTGWTW